ncbi:unnamed protein product [Owenia fusiformis]|uniref:Uncharacterized protein n=1 Tax=Owenia fusiformis TaxID=6347 RepID=A0A8J1V1Z7_OWEFU|nr:unnamed protein product [Owenia fusiformis]
MSVALRALLFLVCLHLVLGQEFQCPLGKSPMTRRGRLIRCSAVRACPRNSICYQGDTMISLCCRTGSPSEGCVYNNKAYSYGTSFVDVRDSCNTCTCQPGGTICQADCPQLKCKDPIRLEGECCPVCPELPKGCTHDGVTYVIGESFKPDACTDCTCEDGFDPIGLYGGATCMVMSCPAVVCERPEKEPSQCCPVCPELVVQPDGCPAGWDSHRGVCYQYVENETKVTSDVANVFCSQKHERATLAAIPDVTSYEFIADTYLTEFNFPWVDSEHSEYKGWAKHNPRRDEECSVMYQRKLFSQPCDFIRSAFVCAFTI